MRIATAITFALLSLAGTAIGQSAYRDVVIRNVPHVSQRDDFCGEACAEMVLRKLGHKGDQNFVFDMSGLDPAKGRGCYSADLKRSLDRIGFKTGEVFYSIDANHSEAEIEEQWRHVHSDLLKGNPSIVCMHYDASPNTTEHMRLVVGYDSKSDAVIYLDPADRVQGYERMNRPKFLSLWPLKYEPAKWLIVRFRMEPGDIRDPVPTNGFTTADYVQHIIALKKQMPKDFSLCIERPFVVVGDQSPDTVKSIAENTVRWAVEHLKRDYFRNDPKEIITIWLFKDDASYRKNAKQLFGSEPTTPYGYYSASDRALIMNIDTGTGTLVHEIVHPFVRANFPKCPAWFNEGLGSLYEQCGERDGHIVGGTNWRLPGLQRAIKAGTMPSFKELTATTESEFYGEDKGTNYSQARYLCYYLQEQGKLIKFYNEFVANQRTDPTGYNTLKKVLGTDDMEEFQKEWEAFVMKLTFR